MKLKTLTLHNIASIPDAVIDFDATPLSEADVFLISGKTGSGKSTILDAICLALYDTIPRFENNVAGGYSEIDDLQINNARQLLRRNTGEGFVSLTFVGTNGVDYEATWDVHRSRNTPDGTIQQRHWELKRIQDKTTVFTRTNDIKEEIKACVGLDFTQFCRTSMLAQGEFSKFLNSKDEDKTAILERLIGEDIYSRIGVKIHEISSNKKRDWETAQNLIDGMQILSDNELKLKEQRRIELSTEFDKTVKAIDVEQSKQQWLTSQSTLEKNLAEALENKRRVEEEVKNEVFIQKQQLVENWRATEQPRKWILDIHTNQQNIKTRESKLENLKRKYIRFLGGILFEKRTLENIEKQLQEIEKYFERELPRTNSIARREIIGLHLNDLLENRKTITGEEDKINNLKKKLNETLIPNQEKSVDETDVLKVKIEEELKGIKTEETELEAFGIGSLREEKDKISKIVNDTNLVLVELNNYLKSENSLKAEQLDYENEKEASKIKQEDITILKSDLEKAKTEEEIARKINDSQHNTISDFAKKMRARLHIGEDCPVCRQKIQKAFMPEDELDALILSYQRAWEKANNSFKDIQQKFNKAEAELGALNRQLALKKPKLEAQESELSVKQKEILIKLNLLGIKEISEAGIDTLKDVIDAKNREINGLSTSISEFDKREKALKIKRDGLTSLQKTLESTKEKVQKLKDEISHITTEIQIVKNSVKERKERNIQTEEDLTKLISGNWTNDWKTDIEEFLKELNGLAQTYNEKIQLKEELIDRKEQTKAIYNEAMADKETIESDMPEWKNMEEPVESNKMDDIVSFGNELIRDVAGVLSNLRNLNAENNKFLENLKVYIVNHPGFTKEQLEHLANIPSSKIDGLQYEIQEVKNNLLAGTTSWEEATKRMEEHKQSKPEFEDDETAETINEHISKLEDARKNILQEIGGLKNEIEENIKKDEEKKARQKVADELKKEYVKWSSLDKHLGDNDGKKFRKIALSYVLGSLIHSANHYMATLSGRYRLRNTPGSFVILVDDAYQSGITRPASTLSGGETFLVSLSLALALSDIGERIGMDTLFIDEGFGTLSGEPLENAVETLRSLHTKTGRHVGIISHIEELKERIPVKILVNQEGNSSASKIQIVP